MALGRLIRAVNAIAVELAGLHVGQIGVPDLVGVLRKGMRWLSCLRVGGVEQAQLDLGGVFGEQGEVDAGPIPGRAQWIGRPGQIRNNLLPADLIQFQSYSTACRMINHG